MTAIVIRCILSLPIAVVFVHADGDEGKVLSTMNARDFKAFLEKKESAERQEGSAVDWKKEKDEWLDCLDHLYSQITDILTPYSQIKISYTSIWISEEFIGRYKARQMTLSIGRDTITFRPIGTNLIAAKGRVDVTGRNGKKARLVLVDAKAKKPSDQIKVIISFPGQGPKSPEKREEDDVLWTWRLVTAPPRQQYVEINQKTVFSMIAELSDGT